ncbi:MAG TPA: thioredoxin domain-containing protein [Bryobacteraceae bacterium]|nr:thioredoxin domain-containing protein [Bryobacteraceae bacterium]
MLDSIPPLIEGHAVSNVRVVIYEDLQCKDCAWFRTKMDEVLLPAYSDRAAFEHREFPLPKHSWARLAAIAARYYPGELGVVFRREIQADREGITAASLPLWIRDFADRHRTTEALLEDPSLIAAVEGDYQMGLAREVKKTPTLFLDEQIFVERISMEKLMGAINKALEPLQ